MQKHIAKIVAVKTIKTCIVQTVYNETIAAIFSEYSNKKIDLRYF